MGHPTDGWRAGTDGWVVSDLDARSPGTLAGLSDVAITNPQQADDLTYDQASGKWVNAQPGGGGGVPAITALFETLSQVALPTNGIMQPHPLDGTNAFQIALSGLTIHTGGDGLLVATPGLYLVTAEAWADQDNTAWLAVKTTILPTNKVGAIQYVPPKSVVTLDQATRTAAFTSETLALNAGDVITWHVGMQGAADPTYLSDGYLQVQYLGPLPA